MKARDLFLAGFGLAAIFLQLPITKMILDDPQSLHLGLWNGPTFLLFSLFTWVVIPAFLGLALAALFRSYPKSCVTVLATGISFLLATQVNFQFLKLHFADSPWRHPLFVGIFLLPIIPLIRFRAQVIQLLKVSGLFGLGIFAYFTVQAAPWRLATPSPQSPAAVQDGPPVFVLTFEKLAASYLADEQGQILEERFPNLARFAHEADYYPEAYASSTATVYALKALYSGRHWTSEKTWAAHPTLKSILGAGRETSMQLDILTEYCSQLDDTCIRTVGQDNLTNRDLLIVWYRTYLNSILPMPIQARVVRMFGLRTTFDDAWDIWGRESGSYADIGLRQFGHLNELVQAQGDTSHLYIMHNFISNGPPVTTSVLTGDTQTEAGRLQDLEAARENLALFDTAFGDFVDRLKASDLYDRSLILISSDTGYDPRQRHVMGGAELPIGPDLMRIFLAIKRPRQQVGRIIPGPFHQVDVLPTILAHLGIDPEPFEFDGIAVTGLEQSQDLTERPVQFSIASMHAGILHYRLADPEGPLRRIESY